MRFIINGEAIPLREVSEERLHGLVRETQDRIQQALEELDSLQGELVRRSHNVIPLFKWDVPAHHDYDGPTVA